MNDTLAAQLAHIVVFLDADDWSQMPRMFTHWKYKKDSKYTIEGSHATTR